MVLIMNDHSESGDMLCPNCSRPIKDDMVRKNVGSTDPGTPDWPPAHPRVLVDGDALTFIHRLCPTVGSN